MRKAAAILLITVYLVNLAGGAMLFEYLIHKNDRLFTERIDEGDYDLSQLVEVKVPLRLHYYSSSLYYERYYGEAEVDGNYYSYVMRKVFNDTVYLLCLPNYSKAELKKAQAHAGLIATDFGGAGSPVKGKGSEGKKQLLLTECCQHNNAFEIGSDVFFLKNGSRELIVRINSCFIEPAGKPPRFNNSHYEVA